MKRTAILLALALSSCLPALTQQPTPKTSSKPSPVAQESAATPSPKPTPSSPQAATPTELQKVKLENLQLKASLLQQQQMQLAAEYNALVQQIVAEHPGYIWNPQTANLMKAPEQPHSPTP